MELSRESRWEGFVALSEHQGHPAGGSFIFGAWTVRAVYSPLAVGEVRSFPRTAAATSPQTCSWDFEPASVRRF